MTKQLLTSALCAYKLEILNTTKRFTETDKAIIENKITNCLKYIADNKMLHKEWLKENKSILLPAANCYYDTLKFEDNLTTEERNELNAIIQILIKL